MVGFDRFLELRQIGDWMLIDSQYHIARFETGLGCGAARRDGHDHDALDLTVKGRASTKIGQLRADILASQLEFPVCRFMVMANDRNHRLGMPVPEKPDVNVGTYSQYADDGAECAYIPHRLSINCRDDIASPKTRTGRTRIRQYLSDQGTSLTGR